MRKYNLGDKVKIRKDLIVGEKYGSQVFKPEQKKYLGKTKEVESINLRLDDAFWIKGCINYLFTDEMVDDKKSSKKEGKAIKKTTKKEKNKFDFKVELLKYPTEQDWEWCKICTLNTVGKKSLSKVTDEWKLKLIDSEHSPLRELWFGIRMKIPYWVSVHFTRHHIGVNHYVQTQRNDRQEKYDRNEAPQGQIVSHIMSVNAQELVFMAHKRLCKQASEETRQVMKKIVEEVLKVCPEFKDVLVPLCVYRNGKCTEFFPCNKAKGE